MQGWEQINDQQRYLAAVTNRWSADMMTNIDEEIDQVVSRKWPAEIDQRSKSSSEEWWPKIKKCWPAVVMISCITAE